MEQNRRSLRLQHDCFQKDVVTQKSANAKSTMGSKTPSSKAKVNVCDVCDMKFQTLQALRGHQNAKHPSEPIKRASSPDAQPKATPKNKSHAAPSSRVSKRLRLLKNRDTEESENSDDQNIMEEKQNKIVFSCPKCEKTFPIYFKALKHIQKKHCEDVDGNPVSPDSPDIIQPVSVETCSKCNKSIDSSHDCDSPKEEMLDQYSNILYCLGCQEQFRSIPNFNKHATHFHRSESDNMFFKTIEEFKIWKQVLETQVKVKYLALNNTGWQNFYQCNYVSPKNEFNKTYFCPSIIEVKELSTGIQTYYSKEHHGHITPEYECPEEFHHYLTNKKNDFDVLINKNPDDDLYIQFKDLMENICTDAKNLTIPHLRKLFNYALKMQGLLNSYDEEHDDKEALLVSKSMTDDQITDALEGTRSSARLKRKSVTITPVEAKKKKDDKSEDESVNSKSKKDENAVKTVSKENKEFDSPKVKARSSPALVSPTFNDSYKKFIDPGPDTTKKSKPKTKEIVKTKMGQFSPKKKLLAKETVENSKPNILKPSKLNTSFGKDIKYEVRERENDCNILILKI